MPAIDVLNIAQNEGVNYDKDLNLLFAASGDIRNVILSVESLPKEYSGSCHCVINDRDIDVTARTIIMILAAMFLDAEDAPETILHIWYSTFLKSGMLEQLQSIVLPLINDVCDKIRAKSDNVLHAKTFTTASCSLRVLLNKATWYKLPPYLTVPRGLSASTASEIRKKIMLDPSRRDYVDRGLFTLPPAWRLSHMRWREEGQLIPLYEERTLFDTPNPTFFKGMDDWPMKDSANPLEGWSLGDHVGKWGNATNDIYGSLYFHVRKHLVAFCMRIRSGTKIRFSVLNEDALRLPELSSETSPDRGTVVRFDRIECANIADERWLGIECTLNTFAPMLKSRTENKHATLITLFINALVTVEEHLKYADMQKELEALKTYLGDPFLSRPMMRNVNNPEFLRLSAARALVRDNDRLFAIYESRNHFAAATAKVGLRMKNANTVIEKWPLMLKELPRQQGAKEEFDMLMASGHTSGERYVEWSRID
ncbi:MAG: hypothetical protein M1822_000765 [Bathelium mastoideum]|nr:MAG: hypothetical protein M1822_000765 [Bathelium mastoideum]